MHQFAGWLENVTDVAAADEAGVRVEPHKAVSILTQKPSS